jgi:hypothetical protein
LLMNSWHSILATNHHHNADGISSSSLVSKARLSVLS